MSPIIIYKLDLEDAIDKIRAKLLTKMTPAQKADWMWLLAKKEKKLADLTKDTEPEEEMIKRQR
jgi:hypothetical protein